MGLLNMQGVPYLAKELKDRLAAIDDRLGLAIMPNAMGDGRTAWAVTYWWGEQDPRRGEVRAGRRDPGTAFDILGFLPEDCSVDACFDYITKRFRMLNDRADVKQMLDNVHKFNAERKAAILRPTMDLADELVETNARHLFRDIGKSVGSSLDVGPRSKRDDKDWRDYLHDSAGG